MKNIIAGALVVFIWAGIVFVGAEVAGSFLVFVVPKAIVTILMVFALIGIHKLTKGA